MIYVATIRGASWVKIGYAGYPRDRLCALRRQHGQILCFVALADGTMNHERRLHERLIAHAVGSETYPRATFAVRQAVSAIKARSDRELLKSINLPTRRWVRPS